MIVKIQRPLATNEDEPMALVYNEDRSFEVFIPYDDAIATMIGSDLKQYWNVELGGSEDSGGIAFLERVEDQPW
jgi:hypothetical protein